MDIPIKVNGIRENMRRTLFRQALFKVQNVEVTYMDSCKTDRVMKRIAAQQDPWSFSVFDIAAPWDRALMREEVWSVGALKLMREEVWSVGFCLKIFWKRKEKKGKGKK